MPAHDTPPELRAALEWLVRLNDDKAHPALQGQFETWLAASAANGAAWEQARAIWSGMDPLTVEFNRIRRKDQLMNRRQMLGAVGGTAVVAAGAWYGARNMARPDYATIAGQTRDITLNDATVVTLGSRSAMNLSFADDGRGIHLLHGEAFVTVAPGTKPFSVSAMGGITRMAQGHLNIAVGRDRVTVAVAERTAAIDVANVRIAELDAGWSSSYDRNAISPAVRVEADNIGSWRRGQLFFNRTPLAEVLENIERWRGGHISLWATDAAAIPVSGIFDTSNPDAALTAVATTLGLNVTQLPGGIAILRA